MALSTTKIHEIIDLAVDHRWSIPEFQRGFVWKPSQVKDLIESLYFNYPIGSLLLWDSKYRVTERIASDAKQPTLWVVDGQQRTTALCILSGRKPYWWESADEWEKTRKKFDIRYDIEGRVFKVADAVIRRSKTDRYIPASFLLNLESQSEKDRQLLKDLARRIKEQGLCESMDIPDVYTELYRICQLRNIDVVTITDGHELEEVVEIFSRLNSKGTRVTEADIYLGIVAARNPGWVRDTFLPYLAQLKDAGFDLNPNLLFRTVTAVGVKKVRFRTIDDEFWYPNNLIPAWQKAIDAWKNLIVRFREYGILSNDLMPTEAALVTLIAMIEKFPNDPFKPALYWFLQASRFGRYSGSGTTSLEEDLRDLSESNSQNSALQKLLNRVDHTKLLELEDFMRDYSDTRFGRFFLYLLVYRNKALDWDEKGHRLGYEGNELLADFRPQWHHIFPRKYLETKIDDDKIDALANIAVIGPKINIRISAKAPLDYINRYKITSEKLIQQFIEDDITKLPIFKYETWLTNRAKLLVEEGNAFLHDLKEDSQNGT